MRENGLAAAYTIRFTTTTPPVVTSTSPVNNAVNVALNKVIQINFNKTIIFGTNSWIELKTTNTGTAKPFTATITGSKLNIKPTTKLAKGTNYTVIIHSNAVTDTTGTAATSITIHNKIHNNQCIKLKKKKNFFFYYFFYMTFLTQIAK